VERRSAEITGKPGKSAKPQEEAKQAPPALNPNVPPLDSKFRIGSVWPTDGYYLKDPEGRTWLVTESGPEAKED
jgi:hypothetical protein